MPLSIPEAKHRHDPLGFPDDFLWGAATSAHQVEGDNVNSDWWEWEQRTRPEEKRSGQATDQYNRYEEDFQLAKDLGHNAHRLSIEWARIEPENGMFNEDAIQHYVEVLKSLKDKNIKVMLTLNHFTLPLWVAKKGGWESGRTGKYFDRFVKKIVPSIKEYVDLWVTINEPNVLVWGGYYAAVWPPQKKSKWRGLRAIWNLAQTHKRVYKTIHKLVPKAKVGIAYNVNSFDCFHHHSLLELLTTWFYDNTYNHYFFWLTGKGTHDFIGINYYFNNYISYNGEARLPKIVDIGVTKKDVSDLGWEINAEGIFNALMDFSDYHLPIYITENGIASTNDDRRVRFLLGYLKEIYHAIATGVKVQGYFHWSLTDNFEWADGFGPRFGLVEIDYDKDRRRTPRPSAYVYKEIIKHNGIPHDLLKLMGHGIKVEEVLKDHKE